MSILKVISTFVEKIDFVEVKTALLLYSRAAPIEKRTDIIGNMTDSENFIFFKQKYFC